MRHHLIRVLAVAMVTGILPAQNQSEIDKLKKEIESLRKQLEAKDVELRKLRDTAAAVAKTKAKAEAKAEAKAKAKAKAQKEKAQVDAGGVFEFFVADGGKKVPGKVVIPRVVFKPVVFKPAVLQPQIVNFGLRRGFALRSTNPLLRGDYHKAVVQFAKLRTKLDKVAVAAKARKVLDEMNRALINARRALWELEKADKKKTKQQREADRRKATAAGRRPVATWAHEWIFVSGGGRFPVRGSLRIGNDNFTYIEKGSTNPLMRGDYRAALMKVIELLRKLNTTGDPKEGRKRLDELSRVILDARRALWEISQAGKKQREAK